jgi:hypothetical protein
MIEVAFYGSAGSRAELVSGKKNLPKELDQMTPKLLSIGTG